jgi:chemotaxis signal transduction protein
MAPSPAAEGAIAPAATQWVVFVCGPQWFGLPLDRSREILPPRSLTRLPGCGPQVGGLVGIRGRVHTVFDFGTILRDQSSLQTQDHRLLVLVVQGRRVAVAVDEVVAISREPLPITPLNGADRPAHIELDDVVGTGVLDGRSFLALDPDRILGRLLT